MLKKTSISILSLFLLYVLTANLFGKSALYRKAIDFIIEKEFSNEYRNYKNLDIFIAFKEGDSYFSNYTLDNKYRKFKHIKSELAFEEKRKTEKYILAIIKPQRQIELGITDLGINIVKGKFTTGYYEKKYLWCFFFWIDLTRYEKFSTPY